MIRTTEITVTPKGEPIFSENGFTVKIEDEGGGEFVKITEARNCGTISIDPKDWMELRDAIDRMIGEIEQYVSGAVGVLK